MTEKPSEKEVTPQNQLGKDVKVVVMRLAPEVDPKKQRIISPARDIIAIKGVGDTNMFCGKCKNFLAQEIDPAKIAGVVIQCYKCKSYNVFP